MPAIAQLLYVSNSTQRYHRMDDVLKSLQEQAKEYAALNPDISQIVIDLERNRITVIRKELTPLDDENASGLKVYQFMESTVENAKAQWEQDFEVWKFKHLDDVTEEELQERAYKELVLLLKSDFLQENYLDVSPSKRKKAIQELDNMGIESTENFVNRYSLLREMLKIEQGRFVVKKAATGRYVQQVKDSLSHNSQKAFIRFATMLKLIYVEMDLMRQTDEEEGGVLGLQLKGELASDKAMKYWRRLRQQKFVDEHFMLLKDTTRQQAMYIAESFSIKLELRTKWKSFEDFWGINNLAQEKNKSLELGKLPARSNVIDRIFED